MRELRRLNIVWIPIVAIGLALISASCTAGDPAVSEAEQFIADTEELLNDLSTKAGRAAWVQANFITEDTEILHHRQMRITSRQLQRSQVR